MLTVEAANTNLILFGFTRQKIEVTIYPTRGESVITPQMCIHFYEDKNVD
jgi:hypothetical protein